MKNALLIAALLWFAASSAAQIKPLTVRAGTLLDGKGGVEHNLRITMQNGKIQSVAPDGGAAADYDLSGFTVMPGWIDTHVHITWHFGPNGRLEDKTETPARATLAAESNAWKTLLAGFTTVQSVGSPEDKDLRDTIDQNLVHGPRILTAL